MMKPPRVQYGPNGEKVTAFMNIETLFFRIIRTDGRVERVPCEIAGLAAGKYAWMRDLTVKCRECGALHPCSDDNVYYCDDCMNKHLSTLDEQDIIEEDKEMAK
jgi:hypothetical protein